MNIPVVNLVEIFFYHYCEFAKKRLCCNMHSTGEMLIKRFVFSYSFQIGFGLVSNQKACILFFHCNFSYHTETNIVTPKRFLGEKFQRDYLFITVTICRNLKKVIPS